VASEPALDHRRVLPGDEQDAHGVETLSKVWRRRTAG
jgi:hypothetical protein